MAGLSFQDLIPDWSALSVPGMDAGDSRMPERATLLRRTSHRPQQDPDNCRQ